MTVEFKNDVEQIVPIVTKGDTLELFFKIRDGYKVELAEVTQVIVVFNRQETGEKYSFEGEYIQVEEQLPQVRLYIQAVPMVAGNYIVKTFLYNSAGNRVSTMPVLLMVSEEV